MADVGVCLKWKKVKKTAVLKQESCFYQNAWSGLACVLDQTALNHSGSG